MMEAFADDVVLNKAALIERCVARAREEYDKDPLTFAAITAGRTRQSSTYSAHVKARWTWGST